MDSHPNWRTNFINCTGRVFTVSAARRSAASCSGVPSGLAAAVDTLWLVDAVWVAAGVASVDVGAAAWPSSRRAVPTMDNRPRDCTGAPGSGVGVLMVADDGGTETVGCERVVSAVSVSESFEMVTVCAVTVDSGLDVFVSRVVDDFSSSFVDGVDEGSVSAVSSLVDDEDVDVDELELVEDDSLDDVAELVPDVDPDPEVSDWPSSAAAMPGLLAIAAPIPSATASAPTLPMNRP